VRKSVGLILVLCGCAAGRTFKTDRFEAKIGEGTLVEEEQGPKGTVWKFLDDRGLQFLGASQYPVAGDPSFPCGIPEVEMNGAPAFYVRRTLRAFRPQSQPMVASVIFPQEDGTVLEFSYEEANEAARALVAKIDVRHPRRERSVPCEVLRSGGPLDRETYDAGLFTARLLPGTWLLDLRHFPSQGQREGAWRFEDAATGKIFLTASQYSADLFDACLQGAVVRINGAAGFRESDTDNLEPYPGPSNVKITFVKKPPEGRYVLLQFFYDEHSETAHLAEETLASLRVRGPTPLDPECERSRTR